MHGMLTRVPSHTSHMRGNINSSLSVLHLTSRPHEVSSAHWLTLGPFKDDAAVATTVRRQASECRRWRRRRRELEQEVGVVDEHFVLRW